MSTKPIAVKHETPAYAGVRTKTNREGDLKKANFDHLMDLLDAHPERVAIRRQIYEFVYEKQGVEIWQ
jgi:hypothetical protein